MGPPRHCSVLGASDFREMAGRGSDQGRLQGTLAFGKSFEGQRSVWKAGSWSVGEGKGPAGAKVGCKEARVALEGAHG